MLGPAPVSASQAAGSLTLDAPAAPRAGTVELRGTVGAAPGEVTSVLYVFDATRSTSSPSGMDCSANGATGPEDDLNADGTTGDVLDCEIAGITSLNTSLAGDDGLQVGLVAFANQAAAADLEPAGSASFVPPAYTGGDARPRIETVAASVVRTRIGLYEQRDLGGSGAGTAFNSAVSTALATLGAAPAGPKWIMFLSDGQAAVDDDVLEDLARSGVKLRSFGVGAEASCAPSGSLYKLAAATGESCGLVSDPSSLSAGLSGSQPDQVSGVTVTIDDVSVAATLDAVGGWRARFTLGAGTYTATARAVLTSGGVHTTRRTFTVASAEDGPPAQTVAPGRGQLLGTAVRVDRPDPTRAAVPSRVTGRVGSSAAGLTPTPRLAGSVVLLQARPRLGAPWTTVDRDRVDRAGAFRLTWQVRTRLRLLQVVLEPQGRYAGSAAAVPSPTLSACTVRGRSVGWVITCLTTMKEGSLARLFRDSEVVDRARVRRGRVRLAGQGSVGAHRIEVGAGRGRRSVLKL